MPKPWWHSKLERMNDTEIRGFSLTGPDARAEQEKAGAASISAYTSKITITGKTIYKNY